MTTTIKVAVVFASGYGHTKAIAEAVIEGASQEGVEVRGFHLPEVDWEYLDGADAIIFGSPTYMADVSADFAKFKDETSKRWFQMAWKDKIAAGFVNSGSWSGDKLNALQSLFHLSQQHAMIWVGLDLFPGFNSSTGKISDMNRVGSFSGLMTQANVDEGVEGIAASDFETARHFGKRVAEATRRWALSSP